VDPFQNKYMLHRYTPLLEQASKYSNPAVVLLQIHATVNQRNLKFDWLKLHITSQLLLFDAETIYRPTIDPGPSLTITIENPIVLRSDASQLGRIKTLQEEKTPKKLNLNNRFIKFTSSLSSKLKFFDCSLNLDRLLTNPDLCMIRILEKQINFTTTQPRQTPRYFILRLFTIPAENDWNDIIISKRIPGLQWLSNGVNFEPYKLIIITKLQSVKVDSLLQPFDRNMWMAIIVANCLFFIVVCVGLKFKEKRKLFLWMISTILSQTDETLTQHLFNKKRLINIALVSSWFYSIFLLNVLYQGDLYSYLSNVHIPILPNSLREILLTNIPLFTFGTICNSDQNCSSILLNKLIPDILKTKEAHENLKNVANKVLNRTEHIPGYHPLFISLDIAINLDKLRTLKKAITPNTFGMLASSEFIDEFNIVAKILFTEHIVRQTHDINPFIAMIPWVTQRGPFATAFSCGIGRLSQSGIVERWSRNFLIGRVMFTTQTNFKSMHDLEKKLVDESTQEEARRQLTRDPKNWEGYGRFYSKFMLVPDKISITASEQSVPLLVMKLPFLACLVLTCFAILVFLIECVAKKIRRSMVKEFTVKEIPTTRKFQKVNTVCRNFDL
jgi:hypothetical protein